MLNWQLQLRMTICPGRCRYQYIFISRLKDPIKDINIILRNDDATFSGIGHFFWLFYSNYWKFARFILIYMKYIYIFCFFPAVCLPDSARWCNCGGCWSDSGCLQSHSRAAELSLTFQQHAISLCILMMLEVICNLLFFAMINHSQFTRKPVLCCKQYDNTCQDWRT